MKFQEMQVALRNQKPHEPDPEAWKGVNLINAVAETQEWLDRLSGIAHEQETETPVPIFPVDQYIDDEERTRAWLNGTDMRRAQMWIHSTLPTTYHVMTELADQMKCRFQSKVKAAMHIPDAYMLTVEIRKEINGDIDTMVLTGRADSKDDIPVVRAIMCRDLLVEFVGKYGIRKANETYIAMRTGLTDNS